MSEIVNIPLTSIDSNPFRQLDKYPYVAQKIDALTRSYVDVGMWEGVIARKSGNRYEIAFGHHRIEAAVRNGKATVPLIVRDLSDEEMLKFMGRENMEDYNTEFLAMLETWEAAVVYLERGGNSEDKRRRVGDKRQLIDVARLLGWTVLHADGHYQLDHVAGACHAAYELIKDGHLVRENLQGLSVKVVREIVQNTKRRMQQIEDLAKQTQRPVKEVEAAKEHIANAAKATAGEVREGNVVVKDVRATIDVKTYRFARKSNRSSPLFEQFGKNLADRIAKMLKGDASERQLEEVVGVLDEVTLDDDKRTLARLQFELGELSERTAIWIKRLTPMSKKVTRLQIAKGDTQ